jgi:hypothetical protein
MGLNQGDFQQNANSQTPSSAVLMAPARVKSIRCSPNAVYSHLQLR